MNKRFAAGISIEELHMMDREQRAALPKPQACHNCEVPYIGFKCRCCGEFRPAYMALMNQSPRRS